jgi:putative hemolysin
METTVIILCLLLSAFFSGMETAYVSANKVYLGVEKNQSDFLSQILARLTENPTRFITSMLLGNTIALVVYAYHMGLVVLSWFYPSVQEWAMGYQLLLQVALSGFIMLLTSEFIPKVLFQVYANTLIKVFAVPAYFFYLVFNHISKVIIVIADFILIKVFGTKAESRKDFFGKGELGTYITEQLGGAEEQEEIDSEIQIFRNALEFSDRKARDIMTPRTEIEAVEVSGTVEELRQLFIETGYSKIMVYDATVDNIIGYVHSFELFKKPATVREAMISVIHAPGTIYIKELLDILTRKRRSMAVILDEYGGTAGIVTVEDIIEELFGDIEDEHDEEPEEGDEVVLEDGAFIFSARLDVQYVNEKYGLLVPESDAYTTLGGFVAFHCGDIPRAGEKFTIEGLSVSVEQSNGKKIESVKIGPLRQR